MAQHVFGIDVSHHNGDVDWGAAVAAGVSFAIAKASEGANPQVPQYTDHSFADHWQAIGDAGLIRGAYHFIGLPLASTPRSQWNDDMHRQIDHFLGVLGPYQPGDLPPAIDLEDGDSPNRWQALIAADRPSALALIHEILTYTTAQLGGMMPLIYTGSFWWSQLGDPSTAIMPFTDYPLWFAQYPFVHPAGATGAATSREAADFDDYTTFLNGRQPAHIPKVWSGRAAPQCQIWQFSGAGNLPAITQSALDLNVFNGSLEDLEVFCNAVDPNPGSLPVGAPGT